MRYKEDRTGGVADWGDAATGRRRGTGTPGVSTLTAKIQRHAASTRPRDDLSTAIAQEAPRSAAPAEDPFAVHLIGTAERGVGSAGQPLPHLDAIQASFGRHEVRGVRAHVGGAASEAAAALGADAYALGNDVAFASNPSLALAAHEAAHVVQQRAGIALHSTVDRAGDAYEQHADAVADLVVQGRSAEPLLDQLPGRGGQHAAIQRKAVAPPGSAGGGDLALMLRALDERLRVGGKDRQASPAEVVQAATVVASMLETSEGPLADADEQRLEAALAGIYLVAASDLTGAEALTAVARRIEVAAGRRGAVVRATAGGRVAGAADDPAARLGAAERALSALLQTVGADTRTPAELTTSIRAASPTIVAILREAARFAAPPDASDDTVRAFRTSLQAMLDAIDHLYIHARANRVDQVQAGLDDIFLAEDELAGRAGLNLPAHRRKYYEGRTPEFMAGKPAPAGKLEPETRTPEAFMRQIRAWFEMEPLQHLAGITSLGAILQEPVRTREPSTLEKVIAHAVSTLVGFLPGHIIGVVSQAITAFRSFELEVPAAPAAAPRPVGFPLNTDPSYRAPAGPAPAKDAATKIDSDLMKAVEKVVSMTAKKEVGDRASSVVKQITPAEQRKGTGALSTAFINKLTEDLGEYMAGVVSRTEEVVTALEVVPPAGLEFLAKTLWSGARVRAQHIRADLVAQWANVVAAATSGVESHEGKKDEEPQLTLAHGGTLEQMVETPGAIRIHAVVRKGHTTIRDGDGRPARIPHPLPAVQVTKLELNGLSPSALDALRTVPKPLTDVPMHRVLFVAIEDAYTGAVIPLGEVDFGPGGAVDVSRVRWAELAALATGDVPDESAGDLSDTLMRGSKASQGMAMAGARMILAYARLTTADLP